MRTRKRLVFAGPAAQFWKNEQGQDMVEYSLLLAFVCLSGAAMYVAMGQTTRGLWGIVNSRLAAANQGS
jgi:Flp pilus assembly pilin Flp